MFFIAYATKKTTKTTGKLLDIGSELQNIRQLCLLHALFVINYMTLLD